MPDSPQADSPGVVSVTVKSNGQKVSEATRIVSIQVQRAVNQVPSARLVIADGDLAGNAWPVSDSDDFLPGASIQISAGHGDGQALLFEGIVVRVGIQVSGATEGRLLVDCSDKAAALTLGRKNAVHVDRKDSELITDLAAGAGLPSRVAATQAQHGELLQYGCSDWDFLVSRAAANGLLVVADDGTLSVMAPAVSAPPVLSVSHGTDLIEFQAEPDGWSQPQALTSGLSRTRGRMKFRGSALARPGVLIQVGGMGARYDGNVFVGAITHELQDGDWVTETEFGLAPEWFGDGRGPAAPPVAGWVPGVVGLQIARVLKLEGDPEGHSRIQIELPQMQAETHGVWARLMQFHASSGFGAFFLPEVGDEVVVGRFNDDPSRPVVLGSLYSSQRKPPHVPQDRNDAKAIVTRCGARIEINEADKAVTIVTPANNQVVLSDKDKSILLSDQNGNKVELHPGGITLDSPKDIKISAQGTIDIDAVGKIGISSQADVAAKGLNIECSASVAFTAKGNASAELSASGQTTVRGALVMIN